MRVLVLLGAHGRYVGLDAARAQANRDHGCDESTKARSVRDSRGCGGGDEDDKADDVDAACAQNGLVLAEVLICVLSA